jgi:hypothetical protein
MNLFPIPETSASVCAGAEARGERTMLTTELLDMLIRHAKEYRVDRLSSLARNTHMHDVTLEALAATSPDVLDAVMVDYLNFVAARQGVDLGLYAEDLAGVTQ